MSSLLPFQLRAARRRWGEDVIKGVLALCALISVATTVGIVVALFLPAIEFFQEVSIWDYLTGKEWTPLFSDPQFGVLPLVGGTFLVVLFAALVCAPFGLGAAIYLSEYAHSRARAFLKPTLEVLAGIPTVVYGYFALTFVTPLQKDVGFSVGPFSALAAALVMGIMLLPTVASVSEDAMSAVPRDLRYGAYALGSTRLQVSTQHRRARSDLRHHRLVRPRHLRAVGETMIVLIAAGGQPNLTFDPREQVQTMTAFIGATAQGDAATGSTAYKTIFAVGATLFVLTLLMNLVSIRLVRRFREVYE